MTTQLSDHVAVRGRFARSIRLDKDAGHAEKLDGYLPTGRSLEVVRRLTNALREVATPKAFSITGPYGSGKSSLALFIDALLGRGDEDAHRAALKLIETYDSETAEALMETRKQLGVATKGFIRAVITAPQREPVTTTVLRALHRGANQSRMARKVRDDIGEALERAESIRYASPSHQEIRELLERLSERRPVLLIIDEFGKNLEAFAEAGREGDLYLLQEIAEWASGADGLPLVVMTIQHLAFEAYVEDATTTQRREWAKVQGRFEDIPFVDSAAATRSLIASALVHSNDRAYLELRREAAQPVAAEADAYGLPTVAKAEHVAACYPLHPSTLLVLPELCARYGQNERTLFSFLASGEARSVMAFAHAETMRDPLPWIRLDRVYDYFVESASTFVGASRDASRWIEVETTIRDAHGLTEAQRRVLKSVGVLNLIAAGGTLRASPEHVAYAAADGQPGTEDVAAVDARLAELEKAGLLVFRDFASEYRMWHGSDFDLAAALRNARREVRRESPANLLQRIQSLPAAIAGRHSIKTGTTRAFGRIYADSDTSLPRLDRNGFPSAREGRRELRGCDGLLVYVVSSDGSLPAVQLPDEPWPVVTVTPEDPQPLLQAAVEVRALLEVLESPDLKAEDRAAHRELQERLAYARQVLDQRVAATFAERATWTWHNPTNKDGTAPRRQTSRTLEASTGSVALSDVFDRVFVYSPPVSYETINRSELTSQGAKARRLLLEAILTPVRRSMSRLGFEGEGPEVAMYRALLEDSGVHSPKTGFAPPTSRAWQPVWNHLTHLLGEATEAPVSVSHILEELTKPPYGLKEGTASVLLVVGLVVHASDIAVYEHGTFRPRLDAPLTERLVRNPGNFAAKHLAAREGTKRHRALKEVAAALIEAVGERPTVVAARANPTVLTVTRAVIDVLHRNDDDFTRKSKRFQGVWDQAADQAAMATACAVRDAILTTQEPDTLLFEQLPAALGMGSLPPSGRGAAAMPEADLAAFRGALAAALDTIEHAYTRLLDHVATIICAAAERHTVDEVAALVADLQETDVLAPAMRRFAESARMFHAYTDVPDWLVAVTEAVCGQSLRFWTDHTAREHLHTLGEAARDYARVADLAQFVAGQADQSFRAYQIQATSQQGQTVRDVVAVPEGAASEVAEAVGDILTTLTKTFDGDVVAAREALLAMICDELLRTRGASSEAMDVGTDQIQELIAND